MACAFRPHPVHPPALHDGNMIMGCSCNGLHMLQPDEVVIEELRDQSKKRKRNGVRRSSNKRGVLEVYWESRTSNDFLQLVVRNTDNEPGSMIASLPGLLPFH